MSEKEISEKKEKVTLENKNIRIIKEFCDAILEKHQKTIKAVWILTVDDILKTKELNIIILIDDLIEKNKNDIKKLEIDVLKKEREVYSKTKIKLHTGYYQLTKYFDSIMRGDLEVFLEIKNSIPIFDPTGFFIPLKELVRKGQILGTKESLIKLITSVKQRFRNINNLKLEVLDNVYIAVLDAAQAALIAANYTIPIQREIPLFLTDCFLKHDLLEKRHVNYCKEIINKFKSYEHGELSGLTGKEIDDLIRKSNLFIERMNHLIKEIEEEKKKDN